MSYTPGTKISFMKGKEQKAKGHLYSVGTALFFDLAETGDYIARRLIPIRYIGAS